MKRVKLTTLEGGTHFSWRRTYLMKLDEEARAKRRCYYLFYFSMLHAWYDQGKRQSEMRREHLHAFCKKRRGMRIMKIAQKHYHDDHGWQGLQLEKRPFPSVKVQLQVRRRNKHPVNIGGVLVRY